jgi:hypothetical protein
MEALKELEIAPPIIAMISLLGVKGAILGVGQADDDDDHVILTRDTLELPEIVIDDWGSPAEYQKALQPAFDALWNAAGFARCMNFDAEGRWVKKLS